MRENQTTASFLYITWGRPTQGIPDPWSETCSYLGRSYRLCRAVWWPVAVSTLICLSWFINSSLKGSWRPRAPLCTTLSFKDALLLNGEQLSALYPELRTAVPNSSLPHHARILTGNTRWNYTGTKKQTLKPGVVVGDSETYWSLYS